MRHRKMLLTACASAVLLLLASFSPAGAQMNREVLGLRPTGVTGELRILSKPEGNSGPLKLWYRFGPNENCPQCEKLAFEVRDLSDLGYNGPMKWTLPATMNQWAEGVMDLEIPPNDTCKLEVKVAAPCPSGMILVYFVSTGDTIEFHQGKIRAADPRSSGQKQADYWQALLSEKQLDYQYDIEIAIPTRYATGRRLLKSIDSLVGPVTPTGRESFYNARVTRRQMLQLLRWNIGFNRISAEYPDVQNIIDSIKAAAPPR